jgi:CcmD family protein
MMPAPLLGELPALPLHTAGKYVAGAYLVIFVLVLVYVVILAVRVTRIERRLGQMLEEQTPPAPQELEAPRPESTLV